jgi:hypothetical protein
MADFNPPGMFDIWLFGLHGPEVEQLRREHQDRLQRCRIRSLLIKERTEEMDACPSAARQMTDSEHIIDMLDKVIARMDDFGDRMQRRLASCSIIAIDAPVSANKTSLPATARPILVNSPVGNEMFVRLNRVMDIISAYGEVLERFQM